MVERPKLVPVEPAPKPPRKRTAAERLRHLAPAGEPFRIMPATGKGEIIPTQYTKERRERFRALAVKVLAVHIGDTTAVGGK